MMGQSRAFARVRHIVAVGLLLVAATKVGPALAQGTTTTPRTAAQIEQLVAPIALYPDALLSQILMASTYPLEVVAAARWSQANPSVGGEALQSAMAQQSWDPSVKALTAVPQTLQMMNEKLDWTQQLGDAFLAQQGDVLDAVQRLRARADASGQLKSTPEQKVTATQRGAGQRPSNAVPAKVYTIEPTNPDEYYVPIYDPGTVYGAWPYPAYEPFYWYPPGYAAGNVLSFAAGMFVGAAIWGNVNWFRNRVEINPLRYNNFNRTNIIDRNWVHNPVHRGAVPYRDAGVAQRFGNQGQSAAREGFRHKANTGRHHLARQGGAAGGKQATRLKNAAPNRKAAAGTRHARSSQTARPKNAAGHREAARHRPSARGNVHAAHGISRLGGASPVGTAGGVRASVARSGGARGGGRRSDVRLKHDIALLGYLENGIGLYRFSYNGGDTAYVGVLAQEVQTIAPQAVARDRDGYLRVFYDKLGLTFQTYEEWMASGARIPPVMKGFRRRPFATFPLAPGSTAR